MGLDWQSNRDDINGNNGIFKKWMKAYFYNHLYVTTVEEITGLKLSIYRDE